MTAAAGGGVLLMSNDELLTAWALIRTQVEDALVRHDHALGKPLCPWGFGDAMQFRAAFDYVQRVLATEEVAP